MNNMVRMMIVATIVVSTAQAQMVWRRNWEELAHNTIITDTNLDGTGGGVNIGTQDITVLGGPVKIHNAKNVGGFDLIPTTGSGRFNMVVEITSVQYAKNINLTMDFVIGTGASNARKGTWFVEYGTMTDGVFTSLTAVDAGSATWSYKGALKDSENFNDNTNLSELFGYKVGGRLQQLAVDATDAVNGRNVAIRIGTTVSASFAGFSDMALTASSGELKLPAAVEQQDNDPAPQPRSAAIPGRKYTGSKPNILFIVSEDNSEHIGCYGETRVHTPALDSLAETGVRYTRAYVPYSVCSPSRAAFLTGLYTRQTGHIGLATHKFSMYKDFKTMPAYFRDAGYYTGFIGKTHVNPERLVEDHIDHRGFRSSNFGKTISIEKYAEEARTVMQNAANTDKPFCLIINYADAHRRFVGVSKNGYPTVTVDEPIEPFPWIGSDSPNLREEIKNYFNCMNRLDEGIGMVLKDLDALDVRDNTLIIYIADHGADFPRAKGSAYECGIRIPMIVNYPKAFSKGKVENQMVSTLDILPTMLELCGLEVPEGLAGINLHAVDEGLIKGHEYIHTFTTGSSPNLQYLQFTIRDDRYKLIYNPYRHKNHLAASRYTNSKLPEDEHVKDFLFPDEYELFDLQEDPYEWKNLADSTRHRTKKKELIAAMKAFQKEINDPFLDRDNLDTFQDEQMEHRTINYRKQKDFRWPHLDLFEQVNKK